MDLVLNGQRRRANAQADFYRAMVEYNKSIANVHFRKGSLLEFNNIQLAEGPWPKKAYWDALGKARERDASYYLDYGHTRPRVISRGPVDQGVGTSGRMEDLTPGATEVELGPVEMESVPTPEPNAEEMQLEGAKVARRVLDSRFSTGRRWACRTTCRPNCSGHRRQITRGFRPSVRCGRQLIPWRRHRPLARHAGSPGRGHLLGREPRAG